MNLIIDVGNTRINIAVFGDSDLMFQRRISYGNFETKALEIIDEYNCDKGIISAVGLLDKSMLIAIKNNIELIELDCNTKVPFNNKYATPNSLGVDRIALVAAAVVNFPGRNTLIIDAGTCITYDFVNFKGDYSGGSISPGLEMRFKALNKFTENLPLIKRNDDHDKFFGNSTETAIQSGVQNGMINEIEGVIEQYRMKNKDLTIVLTGGDINFLSNRLKNGIFANPNFLIEGLNTILTHNL